MSSVHISTEVGTKVDIYFIVGNYSMENSLTLGLYHGFIYGIVPMAPCWWPLSVIFMRVNKAGNLQLLEPLQDKWCFLP